MSYKVLLATRGNMEHGQDPHRPPAYAKRDALITCESLDDAIEQVKAAQEAQARTGDETEHGLWAGGDVWKDGQHLGRIAWTNDAGYHLRTGDKGPLFDLYGHRYEVLLAARGNPDIGQNPEEPPFGAAPDRLVSFHELSQVQQAVRQFIEDEGLGGSQWAGGDVWKDGEHQGVVAYNGRYLPGEKGWLVRDGDYVYGKSRQHRAGTPTDTFEGVLCSLSKEDWDNVLAVYPSVAETLQSALATASPEAAPVQVSLVIQGGLVQNVIASRDVEATLVDYDTEGADPGELLDVPQTDGGKVEARVADFPVEVDPDRANELRAVLEDQQPLPTP